MNSDITSLTKTVQYGDVDFTGCYKISSLFQSLADLATQDAIKLGLWSVDLMEHYGWVVAKQSLYLDEPIMLNDVIEISTYADKGTFVTFPRYYLIKKNDKVIGRISSIWTLLDLKKRSIVAPKRIGLKGPVAKNEVQLELPKNIHEEEAMTFMIQRKVLYSDIDTNRHMNNTKYLEWAFDLLDLDIFEKQYIKELSINYKKEIKPHSLVDLYLSQKDNQYVMKGQVNNEDAFIIEFYCDNR